MWDDLLETEQLLSITPLLQGLNEQQLSALAGAMETTSCRQDQKIVEKGTPGNFLVLIKSGRVRCTDLSDGTYEFDDADNLVRLEGGGRLLWGTCLLPARR
jgi:signal-transduction protein with cAMP-binding, CBS, and nucleotidyltransferase domain